MLCRRYPSKCKAYTCPATKPILDCTAGLLLMERTAEYHSTRVSQIKHEALHPEHPTARKPSSLNHSLTPKEKACKQAAEISRGQMLHSLAEDPQRTIEETCADTH